MTAANDRPSAQELQEFAELLHPTPIDRPAVVEKLRRIERGLRDHGKELARSNGLLNEADKADRTSLGREDDRLRVEGSALLDDLAAVREVAVGNSSDDDLKGAGERLLVGLRAHRDAENSLVLENAVTEVGAGD